MRHLLSATLISAVLATVACDSFTEPLRPGTISAHTAVEQDAVVGTPAGIAPAVRVTTTAGKAVPGVEVTFAVQGGGTIASTLVRTDASGVASAGVWTLGTAAGVQEVVATTAALVGPEVRFRATAAAGEPRRLNVITQLPATVTAGVAVTPQPTVQLLDQYGNAAAVAGVVITASVTGGATVSNQTATTNTQGIATFSGLALDGAPGVYSLQFNGPALATAFANSAITLLASPSEECTAAPLALPLGGLERHTFSGSTAPRCLRFAAQANAGQQYMLLFENMPLQGGYESGVFPGTLGDTTFQVTLRSRSPLASPGMMASLRTAHVAAAKAERHSWDFGDGPIYELEPPLPAEGVDDPQLLRGGRMMNLHSAAAEPQIGDTVVVRMEGIQRLSIQTGNQKAVIRYISPELIIAEDARLTTTLIRQGGGFNTPLTETDLEDIAREYAAIARVQGDAVFQGRFNSAIEANSSRVLAVHSLMGSDGIWGYTYSTGDYFVWDYWVGTNGVTRGLSQNAQRVADNLFMHEIAHMRHVGLLQRNGVSVSSRGNRWLVEGFARHTERFAIAQRLLGTVSPSRTGNVVLPRNSAFGNTYFRDDVPTFLNAGTSMFGGYQHSSFVFDYFMDQVAVGGGDHLAALRDLVLNAGRETTADAAVSRWLPGITFAELFTRARIALYLDDIGITGLPAWTQYHQYRLRDSRPAGSAAALDPRSAWPRLTPGVAADLQITVGNGAAYGVVIDGAEVSAGNGVFLFDVPGSMPNAVMSITRIR